MPASMADLGQSLKSCKFQDHPSPVHERLVANSRRHRLWLAISTSQESGDLPKLRKAVGRAHQLDCELCSTPIVKDVEAGLRQLTWCTRRCEITLASEDNHGQTVHKLRQELRILQELQFGPKMWEDAVLKRALEACGMACTAPAQVGHEYDSKKNSGIDKQEEVGKEKDNEKEKYNEIMKQA